MDPTEFHNETIRMRFSRDQIEALSPALHFACNAMESHKKTDTRQSGRYNLIRLIERSAELNLKEVNFENLSLEDKEALKLKCDSIIADCYKTRWGKSKESLKFLEAHIVMITTTQISTTSGWSLRYRWTLPGFTKITGLERIDGEYFDFRFHSNATVMVQKEIKKCHVALNEGAVLKSFLSQEVELFNMSKFSAFFRWGWAKFQNNECVIEGFISMAENQSFNNQKDETLEDRLIVTCNSDTFASTR